MKPNNFVSKIYSKATIRRITKKISALGVNNTMSINTYLTVKFFLLVAVFFIALFGYDYSYFAAPVITLAVYYIFDYIFLTLRIKKRAKILEKDAIFFFEVLALTIQSEKNLKLCLENTCAAIDSDLSSEFKQVLHEVKIGKSLTEALTDAKERIPSKNVNNILLNILESYVYGNSLSGTLENQINYLTDKRILDIKEQINKMPTKISVISVIFFVPLVLLLILGPLLINYFIK